MGPQGFARVALEAVEREAKAAGVILGLETCILETSSYFYFYKDYLSTRERTNIRAQLRSTENMDTTVGPLPG